jgi:hypothetical protein
LLPHKDLSCRFLETRSLPVNQRIPPSVPKLGRHTESALKSAQKP